MVKPHRRSSAGNWLRARWKRRRDGHRQRYYYREERDRPRSIHPNTFAEPYKQIIHRLSQDLKASDYKRIQVLKWAGCISTPALCPVINATYELYRRRDTIINLFYDSQDIKNIYQIIKNRAYNSPDIRNIANNIYRIFMRHSNFQPSSDFIPAHLKDMIFSTAQKIAGEGIEYLNEFPSLGIAPKIPSEKRVQHFLDSTLIISSRKMPYLNYVVRNNITDILKDRGLPMEICEPRNIESLVQKINPISFLSLRERDSRIWDFTPYEADEKIISGEIICLIEDQLNRTSTDSSRRVVRRPRQRRPSYHRG